ncbi:tRNA (N(6)-L-threonylcarbamoyladenosine(37)-C(2))-methylthiotransferase MtaB [Aliarcobacter butzleri]|uniref:tRNA (N(6)-L-threonylcarbamoyladenosine(37)-C(2))-methylthiotransferase MtaB n=1 Tax=Aliarcobacter butzleri TaxID=28197 RepID=A0AAP4UXJ7_9BACT|nr:tRNA (N(6)-L-threonylcarbamoyladenosine(37)-C(2))-methylthiotransferase MtaB [Aliarcobacter butzleri]MCG3682619.1 tRNA (N(6)-L-threonylcarbamoyladenosine(37)-C(2))-methylthiotransferase MtaB [Aliarcobacter butzleri]MCG3687243.1 tRNA (N(6)-L-threonylcarbamoyladenosine(37)-C(2))-methylthiotransferase MtaB [Aliarcobacter butzleri]MCG3703289.1 tRNA (N(6)-L-threonylcarbamoyladenosine(37)-C(2))-methylthiotransferase MtaB [Aliarcobacter butzleri]MDK2061472.1 tRNA (N(6)-L-threonylcarbamoyladenosine(
MNFSQNRPKVYFKTFGCRTNVFDTQVMMSNLKDFEVTLDENEANIVVINSCTVTNSADSTARTYINSLKKLPQNPRVIFTGCGVWTKGETLFKENKVDSLFGHSQKENINDLLLNEERFFEAGDLTHIDKTIVEEFVGKSRAFIKIQEGCDFRCSYCIIPYVRGDARSYSEDKILEQVTTLAANGFGEFILTGTNVGSYGKKQHTSLAKLLKKMSLIKGVRRIRMGSIEPIQIDDEFKEIINEPFMAKHLHIALQHTSKEMLKIMNRRNKVLSDLELFEFLRENGYALGTDFIVGHPGETEALWKEAMENLHRFPLTHIHAFTYSKRDGTPSATMKPQIKGDIAKVRYNELINIIEQKNYNFRKENKKTLEVLVEQEKNGKYIGLDQFFNQIEIDSTADLVGDWVYINDYEVKADKNVTRFK